MRNSTKKILALVLAMVLALAMTACGNQRNIYTSSNSMKAAGMAPDEMAMPSDTGGFASMEMVNTAEWDADVPESAEERDAPAEAPSNEDIQTDKIIYSANVTVETTDLDATVEKLNEMIQICGGFVETSSMNGNNYYAEARGYGGARNADYTIRVPYICFEDLMNHLGDLGNVPYSYTYTENITAQYYDTQARLNAYRAQEERLIELLDVAESVEDIVTIEDRLTWTRYEIESLQSTMKNWDRQVSYSTINLSIREVIAYTPEASLSFGQQIGLAIRNGWSGAVEFLKGMTLFFLEAFPFLLMLAVVVVVVIVIVRKRKKAKARKKAAAQQEG